MICEKLHKQQTCDRFELS